MNKLLKEFLSYILVEETPAEKAKKMGLTSAGFGRWKNNQGVITHKTEGDELVPVGTTDVGGVKKKPAEKPETPQSKDGKAPQKPASNVKPKKAGPPAVTAGTVDPNSTAADIAERQLASSNEKLVAARRKGIAGPGGAVASYGEASLTQLATQLNRGGLQNGMTEFRQQNKEAIDRYRESVNKIANTKNGKKRITAVGTELGLDPETDSEAIIEYIASREAYVDAELARLEADKEGIFYKKGNSGFGENTQAAREWAIAAFDGAIATSLSMQASTIDSSKPYTVIQSDVRGHDNELLSHLRQNLESATTDEDKAHYQKQLDAWEIAKFHDTMVVGVDGKGRMTVFHVTNKKGNDLKDIWNNTTPAQAMGSLLERFKRADEGMTVTEKKGFARVTVVMQKAVDVCADASNAAIRTWADKNFKIDKPFVDAVQQLRRPPSKKDYVEPLSAWMDTAGRGAAAKEFQSWKAGTGKKDMAKVQRACSSNPKGDNCTAARLAAVSNYMKTNPKSPPPFEPVGKLLTKVGESELKAGGTSKGSLGLCARAKQLEKDAVATAHKMVVDEIRTSDEKTCKSTPDACKPNGPAARMYLEHVMHSMHFDMMVDNWDENLAAVTGIRSSQPTDFRETLRDASSFEGSIDTPEQRAKLRQHIVDNAKIDADSGAIVISSPNGDFVLVEDSWRTAGTSQKVQKTVGDGVRTGVIKRSDTRRKDNSDTIRGLLGRGE